MKKIKRIIEKYDILPALFVILFLLTIFDMLAILNANTTELKSDWMIVYIISFIWTAVFNITIATGLYNTWKGN